MSIGLKVHIFVTYHYARNISSTDTYACMNKNTLWGPTLRVKISAPLPKLFFFGTIFLILISSYVLKFWVLIRNHIITFATQL